MVDRLFLENLCFSAILMVILFANNIFLYKQKIRNPISLMLLSGIAMCIADILWTIFEGRQDIKALLYVFAGAYSVFFTMFSIYLNRYLIERFGLRPERFWKIIVYQLPFMLVLLLCVTTPWTHLVFRVDETGTVQLMILFKTLLPVIFYSYVFSPLVIAVYFLTIGKKKRPANGEIPPSIFVFGILFSVLYWIQLLILGDDGSDKYLELSMAVSLALTYLVTNVSTHTILNTETRMKAVETDLRIASKIQSDALPPAAPEFADHPELSLRCRMNTAKEVGGDFYDYFPIDNDRICFLIADVSGKGTPAALFMMTAKTMIRDYAMTCSSTAEIFNAVNARLCENNDEGMFATAWIGILDTGTMTLQYTNAGHDYPLLQRKGRPCELMETTHGLFLAGLEMTKYSHSSIQLEPGDRILLYTDGVTEAHDRKNGLYGIERLKKMTDDLRDCSGERMLDSVLEDLYAFSEGVPQFDDITMAVLTLTDAA